MNYKSIAIWPPGLVDDDRTEDNHPSRESAWGACCLLRRNGFGGDGKVFPIHTWTQADPRTADEERRAMREQLEIFWNSMRSY